MKPATNPVDAWQEIKRHETISRIEERGKGLFAHSDAIKGSGDYRACVYLDSDGIPTRRFQVGKPIVAGQGDYTTKGGGPYIVDLDAHTCTCPWKTGLTKEVNGKIVVVREPAETCKHIYGLNEQRALWEYELRSIKNVTDRKLIVWTKRKDKKENENDN